MNALCAVQCTAEEESEPNSLNASTRSGRIYCTALPTKESEPTELETALKLQELDRPYRLVMFENGGHGVRRIHQDAVTLEVVEWFLK